MAEIWFSTQLVSAKHERASVAPNMTIRTTVFGLLATPSDTSL